MGGLDLLRLYPFDSQALAQGDFSWEVLYEMKSVGNVFFVFGKDGLNIGQILRLTPFAQDDQVGVIIS